jgi:hypothetical protein
LNKGIRWYAEHLGDTYSPLEHHGLVVGDVQSAEGAAVVLKRRPPVSKDESEMPSGISLRHAVCKPCGYLHIGDLGVSTGDLGDLGVVTEDHVLEQARLSVSEGAGIGG